MLRINNILLAHDLTEFSARTVGYAVRMARRFRAHLHVLHADVPYGEPSDVAAEAVRFNALREKLSSDVAAVASGIGGEESLQVSPLVVQDVAVAPAILGAAAEMDVDLIVTGTHGKRGLQRALLGSVAEEVVRHAPCPVLTVRADGEGQPTHTGLETILVPVDFSAHAQEAVGYARSLAALFEARVHLLHVAETPYHSPFDNLLGNRREETRQADVQARLNELYHQSEGPASDAVTIEVSTGLIGYEIIACAERIGASLIVMATHGLTGLRHVIVGSVAERVVRTAPCPVFTVKSFGKSLLQPSPLVRARDAHEPLHP